MSHLVTIQTEVRDRAAMVAACRKLHLQEPVDGTATLFSGEATGCILQLPGWKYPVVCDLEKGELRFDNFEGRWGAREELDRFFQRYAVEKAVLEARRRGYTVVEQPIAGGSIKLTVQMGASA